MNDIIIIGAGLSGLTLAHQLQQEGINCSILEASARIGGRIYTAMGSLETPLELGASWFSDMHPHLMALIPELGLDYFPQHSEGVSLFQSKSIELPQQFYVPAATAPSYRIAGGTYQLIKALESKLPPTAISRNRRVVKIAAQGDHLSVTDHMGKEVSAKAVVSCIPPQLVQKGITFEPQLPEALNELMPAVQTWMEGAVKFAVEYKQPVWRQAGFSGMLYSHAGLVVEMYDHNGFDGTTYSLVGFLNGSAASYPPALREQTVIRQLATLFGPPANDYISYLDKVWSDENIAAGNVTFRLPHENNGHPLLQQSYLDHRFFFCGTEVSTHCPGYMEGAVYAAMETVKRIKSVIR